MTKQDKKTMTEVFETLTQMTPVIEEMKNEARHLAILKEMMEKIQPLCEEVDDLYWKHEDYFEERSERWQESNKGYEYYEKVKALDSINNNMSNIMTQLDWLIED